MNVQRLRIVILEKMVDAGNQLRAKGLMSEVDQRHREESLLAQRQALIELNQQLMTRKGQLSEVRFNLEQLPFAQSDKIQAMRNELSATDQRIAEVSGRGAYIVRAPIGGRVSLLRALPGQFADPRRAHEIMPGRPAARRIVHPCPRDLVRGGRSGCDNPV